MKRDLQQQFLIFTGQVNSKVWWKYLNAEASLLYMWKERPVILLLKQRGDLGKDCIYLSDRFFDINNPTREELELFYLEDEEACNILFLNKEENNG